MRGAANIFSALLVESLMCWQAGTLACGSAGVFAFTDASNHSPFRRNA